MSAIVKVAFHGDDLDTVKNERGVWVSIRRVCEALGLDLSTQLIKLRGKAWAVVGVIPMTGPDGKTYETSCIHLDALPMWLATIDAGKVRADVATKLEVYQVEVAKVLRDHFLGKPTQLQGSRDTVDLFLRARAHSEARRGTFSDALKREFLRLRRISWDGKGSEPQGLAFAYGRTWRIILGDEVYAELKSRNPEPRDGSSHSQWLKDEVYKLAMESDLQVALAYARESATWSEYEGRMRSLFRKAPIQLGLIRNDRKPLLAARS